MSLSLRGCTQVLLKFDLASRPHSSWATIDFRVLANDSMHTTATASKAVTPNALVYWLDYTLNADGLVIRGLPEDTTVPSHHRVAVKFIEHDMIWEDPIGANVVTVHASFDANSFDMDLEILKLGSAI
eukprot:gnl/TRDRNA2_/TRDRNA2_140517_c0_seq1.p1 gnl/TRDRNA2_/TRDRNA2_140517_c0~~gnl/TRDRNA2_/TRDRNA2_140517_c0_seq1.p1  ORF type:complete len:128 (+),score=20.50 gnl/TRDRNA2_/TRDRNA2_140517_c0_seq1:47-430(+)